MRLYLADYSIDMEVYDYWLWRYYPEWLSWWQSHRPQANQDTQDSAATAEGAATAVDSAQGASATTVDRVHANTVCKFVQPQSKLYKIKLLVQHLERPNLWLSVKRSHANGFGR